MKTFLTGGGAFMLAGLLFSLTALIQAFSGNAAFVGMYVSIAMMCVIFGMAARKRAKAAAILPPEPTTKEDSL